MKRSVLSRALFELEQEGTLDVAQRRRVEEKLAELSESRRSLSLIGVVSMLGGILVAVGLLFFVASHWNQIPRGARLAGVVLAVPFLHVLGERFAVGPGRYPRTGRALTTAGVLAFGPAIFLIADVYGIRSNEPHAMLFWWALNVPFVLLSRSRVILAIVIGLFATWSLWQAGQWLDQRGHGTNVTIAAAFCLLGLTGGAFFRAWVGVVRGTRFEPLELVFRQFAAPAVLGALYGLSFRGLTYDRDGPLVALAAFVPAAILGGIAFLMLLRSARRPDLRAEVFDPLAVLAAAALFAVLLRVAPASIVFVANALLFATLLWIIRRGIELGVPLYVNYGIFGFLVAVMTRYFEYLADRLDDAFLVFIGAGVLLIGVGLFLERRRRALMARMREDVR